MSDKALGRRTDIMVAIAGTDISKAIKKSLISFSYTDNEEDGTDDLQIKLEDRDGKWLREWLNHTVKSAAAGGSLASSVKEDEDSDDKAIPENKGLKVQGMIVQKNWKTDGNDKILDCGVFELDDVSASGPPSEITMKCTSLPYASQIRQTKKSRAWEGYSLSGIANEMANKNNMGCMYESSNNPYYNRTEQVLESDISFLSDLCHNAGISLKATDNILVLFDQAAYEKKPPVKTIRWGQKGGYSKYKLSTGKADKEYQSCRVQYTNPKDGQLISATAYVEDYKEDGEDNQQLEEIAKVASVGEALELAQKRLRLHNKYERGVTFTFAGDTNLVAGITVMLDDGWGMWAGKYIIKTSKHSVGSSGYSTQITLRNVLEGY